MTKENQRKLLEHYKNIARTKSGIIAENAKRYAQEIIDNYPGIEEMPIETTKKGKKKGGK